MFSWKKKCSSQWAFWQGKPNGCLSRNFTARIHYSLVQGFQFWDPWFYKSHVKSYICAFFFFSWGENLVFIRNPEEKKVMQKHAVFLYNQNPGPLSKIHLNIPRIIYAPHYARSYGAVQWASLCGVFQNLKCFDS